MRGHRTFLGVFMRALLRNRLALFGAVFLTVLILAVLLEPILPLQSATRINLVNAFSPPSATNWLGTDENGRDVLARLIKGGQISLLVGFAAAILTVLVGSVLGLAAGYFGGITDRLIMRFTDGFLAIPVFFLLLAVVALWGSTPTVLVIALGLTRWMGTARLVRGEVMRFKSSDFVAAAGALGAPHSRIMFRHLLPQTMPALIVSTSMGVGNVMLLEAGFSYLGLGILPPTPSWGNMLTASQYYVWSAPVLAVYPGVLILLTVLSFNAIGDVLRDSSDPRRRSGG